MKEDAGHAASSQPAAIAQGHGIEAMRAMGQRIARDTGVLGVLALLFGFWVVLVQAMSRNAFPEFSGEEWLPRLFSVGVSCGLMAAALMACLPGLDLITYRAPLELVQALPGDGSRVP